jgi:hypothetical protein
MLDMERELLAESFATFDLVYSRHAPLFAQLFANTKLPWLFGEYAEEEQERSMVGKLVDLYRRHQKGKKSGK